MYIAQIEIHFYHHNYFIDFNMIILHKFTITINGQKLDQITEFSYFGVGSILTEDGNCFSRVSEMPFPEFWGEILENSQDYKML